MITAEQKDARVARAKKHAELDRLVAGTYCDGRSRGCSVGCDAIDIVGAKNVKAGLDYHKVVADHDGTPVWLEHLRDAIFEGLPEGRRSWWHVSLAESLPVGVDLQPTYHKIQIAILDISLRSLEGNKEPYAVECRAAIETVQHLHRTAVPEESAARSAAWSAARSAAWSAAWSAEGAARSAEGAARSAAWSAARSAAEIAEGAAWSAAWSAASAAWSAEGAARSAARSAEGAARSAAESAAYSEIADTILKIFCNQH